MPLYPFRCADCGDLTEELCRVGEAPDSLPCGSCGSSSTRRVIGRSAYLTSDAQKSARLDPRYDAQVDRAIANTRHADPNRFLGHLNKPTPTK